MQIAPLKGIGKKERKFQDPWLKEYDKDKNALSELPRPIPWNSVPRMYIEDLLW